jgi:hypothetical protein
VLRGALPRAPASSLADEIAEVRRLEDLAIGRLRHQIDSAGRLDSKAQLSLPFISAAVTGYVAVLTRLSAWQRSAAALLLFAPVLTTAAALWRSGLADRPEIARLLDRIDWKTVDLGQWRAGVLTDLDNAFAQNEIVLRWKDRCVKATFLLLCGLVTCVIVGALVQGPG